LSSLNLAKMCRREGCGGSELDLPEMRCRSSLYKTEHTGSGAGGARSLNAQLYAGCVWMNFIVTSNIKIVFLKLLYI